MDDGANVAAVLAVGNGNPLAALPEALVACVCRLLSPRDLACMAQACRVWRRISLTGLSRLVLDPRTTFPWQQLRDCSNLQQIIVRTNCCSVWREALRLLQEQSLSQLQSLVIEYWIGRAQYDELSRAMQVCCSCWHGAQLDSEQRFVCCNHTPHGISTST